MLLIVNTADVTDRLPAYSDVILVNITCTGMITSAGNSIILNQRVLL